MPIDELRITILEDGTFKIETDQISAANHLSAEQFIDFIQVKLGGDVQRQRKPHAHNHTHEHQTGRI